MNVNSKNILKVGSAYMLRDDGEVFNAGEIHPYIIYRVYGGDYLLLYESSATHWWRWFYDHTNSNEVKQGIIKSLKILYTLKYKAPEFIEKIKDEWSFYPLSNNYDKVFKDFNISKKDFTYEINYFSDFKNVVKEFKGVTQELNEKVNQEFCRFRLGDSYSTVKADSPDQIYFRVSSKGFNWFNLIWTLVYNNKDILEWITIVRDRQALGKESIITIKGYPINHASVDTFLELPGNPVVESFNKYKNTRTYLSKKSLS